MRDNARKMKLKGYKTGGGLQSPYVEMLQFRVPTKRLNEGVVVWFSHLTRDVAVRGLGILTTEALGGRVPLQLKTGA